MNGRGRSVEHQTSECMMGVWRKEGAVSRIVSASLVGQCSHPHGTSLISLEGQFLLEGHFLVLLIFVKGQFLVLVTLGLFLSGVLRNVGQVMNTRGACWSGPFASVSSFRMMLPNCMAFRHSWRTGCADSGQAPGTTQTTC